MILEVKQFGDEVLRKPSVEVNKKELKSKDFRRFIKDMLETMYGSHGVGLAAPQVGVNKRIIVIDINWPTDEVNPLILINPKIVYTEGEIESEEGCLSFKGSTIKKEGVLLTKVKRFRKVKVNFVDLENKKQSIEADGDLLSRCLQHEIDHLDGILFIDRDQDLAEVEEQLKLNGFEVKKDLSKIT
ncbi:MAG: peptide deformylase [Candidatus Caenarcaniphilales bacterium]|nr:peptide deformylase [Candidatus Caenarcaniphilales bacterium]